MAERTYGFEIESEIKHNAPINTALPTIETKRRGDTLIGSGLLTAGLQTPVSYQALYNNSLAHFEVVVAPFDGLDNLQPLMSEAYDIAKELPSHYLPWRLIEAVYDKEKGYFAQEREADASELSVSIDSVDISCAVGLNELGLLEEKLPRVLKKDAGLPQWSMRKLPYTNSDLRFIFDNPTGQIKRISTWLRRINGVYVLHTNFGMSTTVGLPQKDETISSVVTSMRDITKALEGRDNRSFAVSISL